MKLAVLGATGPSGLRVIAEALKRGHVVKALVRSPDKITTVDDKLEIIKADIWNPDELARHLADVDVVISCLGSGGSWFNIRPVTFYLDTAKPIMAAMEKAGKTRFIYMSSWYTVYNRSDPFIMNWILKPLMLKNAIHNMGDMERYIQSECPDVDFTSVRCPQLLNAESSGKPVMAEAGQEVKGGSYLIPRADVAVFMLDCAETGSWSRQFVAITKGK